MKLTNINLLEHNFKKLLESTAAELMESLVARKDISEADFRYTVGKVNGLRQALEVFEEALSPPSEKKGN